MHPTTGQPVAPSALQRMLGDWRGTAPTYQSLADRIQLLVQDGRMVTGTRLPAERELAATLGHSRATVTAAYAALRDRGVVRSLRGSGSVVTATAPGAAMERPAVAVADLSKATPGGWEALPGYFAAAIERVPQLLATHGIDFTGLPLLRARLADRYTARGLPTTPEQLLVTVGAQHAIGLILRTLLHRGDRVAVDVPSYPHALDAFRDAGARVIPIAMPDLRVDIDAWERVLLTARPALAMLVPDFHNPTGSSMPDADRRRIIAAAARSGTVLIVDETTAEMLIDGEPRTPMAALAAHTDATVVTIGSASKTIWHGLRIGWIRASSAIIEDIAARRPASDLGTPVVEQLVVAEVLPDMAELLAFRGRMLGRTRDAVIDRLHTSMPEWQVPRPAGGLCLWVQLGAPVSSALAVAARGEQLLVTAGPRFGVDGSFERFLRIPITAEAPSALAAIDLLERAWLRIRTTALTREQAFTPML